MNNMPLASIEKIALEAGIVTCNIGLNNHQYTAAPRGEPIERPVPNGSSGV